MTSKQQDAFFADVNKDGTPDGLAFISADANRDGRPDLFEVWQKGLEAKFFLAWIATALGVILITLAADFIGHALGWH